MPTDKTTELTVELFRIKSLEWERFERSGFSRGYKTVGISGALVFQDYRGSGGWSVWHWMPREGGTHVCTSPEEGKQLAEQHWQEYIKQALVLVENHQ